MTIEQIIERFEQRLPKCKQHLDDVWELYHRFKDDKEYKLANNQMNVIFGYLKALEDTEVISMGDFVLLYNYYTR